LKNSSEINPNLALRGRTCSEPLASTHPDTQGLDTDDTGALLDRWCSKATRSRLPPFVRVSKTIRKHREGILAAIELAVNNARAEGLNNHVRLITRRAYGFHSAHAALALVMLSCGPITLRLPHEPKPG